MRRAAACALLTSAAAAAAFAMSTPATAKKTATVDCELTLHATIPQPAATAANFGAVNCDAPLLHGVQEDSSTVTRSSLTTGTFTGPFKMYFDRGTISGTFEIAFVTTLSPTFQITNVDYEGTLEVTSGTGRYKHVRGTGTITGTSPDAKVTTLHETLSLTGV